MDPKEMDKTSLNIKTIIPLSDKIDDPAIINSTGRIELIFDQDVDMNTVLDGIKIYNIKSDGKEVEENIVIDKDSSSTIYISKSESLKFTEGEEYKLFINKNVKSLNGVSLKKEFKTYFAVDYSFNLEGISDLNNQRTMTVCISDLHLGVNDSYAEINRNRDALIDFLNRVRASPNIKELVIAGDLIDEWFIPRM